MLSQYTFPTPEHARAAHIAAGFFAAQPGVDAVLLMGSCARGKAAPTSCVDLLVLVPPADLPALRPRLEALWQQHYAEEPVYKDLLAHGPFSHVDLEFIDGTFPIPGHGWTSGADPFELEIGNTLAYTLPLWQGGDYYDRLRARWLPYYPEDLRRQRLQMVLKYCRNNLDHIPLYAPRGLYFQCFKRFYQAFEEFLQALFIARSVYPIAYDKWLREQFEDILHLPECYAQLPHLFEIQDFESDEIVTKARQLSDLLAAYVETPSAF